MIQKEKKVLLIGLGVFERNLFLKIRETFNLLIVDKSEDSLKEIEKDHPEVETLNGDASSIITLKNIDFSCISHIICSIKDRDVVREVVRMLRVSLNVECPILLISYDDLSDEELLEKDVTVIRPLDIGSQVILNKMEKNLIRPINIGKGIGEIIEVTIKTASYLTGRKLKYLRPKFWHVSMIYRNNEPVIPTGEIKLKIGDRVIIAGNPKVLENIANLLIKGNPQFPLQYGKNILYPLEKNNESCLLEASMWLKHTNIKKIQYVPYHNQISEEMSSDLKKFSNDFEIVQEIQLFNDMFNLDIDTGLIFLRLKTFFKNARIRSCFKYSKKPVLISRNSFPYQRILLSLNTQNPTIALETGIEISRLLNIPLELSMITAPNELKTEKESEHLEEVKSIIREFQNIFNTEFKTYYIEGNPVRETLSLIRENPNTLLITVFNPEDSTKLFNTNVPYLLTKKTKVSTLIIPGENVNV